MPDFDAAIRRTVDAQRKVTEAAAAVSADITEQRQREQAETPVVLPVVAPLPPTEP